MANVLEIPSYYPLPVDPSVLEIPQQVAPSGQCLVQYYFWNGTSWDQRPPTTVYPWYTYPAGWGLLPDPTDTYAVFVVVLGRNDTNGDAQPIVLDVDPKSENPSPHCPPGWVLETDVKEVINGVCLPVTTEPPIFPCPAGMEYDVTAEKCVIKVIPVIGGGQGGGGGGGNKKPPPNCPPGTVYNPQTGNCDPIVVVPPPSSQLDEIGDCCVQTNANLVLIQNEIKALQLSITGQGGNPDPVTCQQLSGLFNIINVTLHMIVTAISNASSAGGSPVDLTPLVEAINTLGSSLGTTLGLLVEAIAGGSPLVNPTPPEATPYVQPATYTVTQALADLESTIPQLPFQNPVVQ